MNERKILKLGFKDQTYSVIRSSSFGGSKFYIVEKIRYDFGTHQYKHLKPKLFNSLMPSWAVLRSSNEQKVIGRYWAKWHHQANTYPERLFYSRAEHVNSTPFIGSNDVAKNKIWFPDVTHTRRLKIITSSYRNGNETKKICCWYIGVMYACI